MAVAATEKDLVPPTTLRRYQEDLRYKQPDAHIQ